MIDNCAVLSAFDSPRLKPTTPSLLLFFVLLFTLSCASPNGDAKRNTHRQLLVQPLTLWHALRGTDQENLRADLDEYERETGERVTSLQLPHNAYANKLQVAIPRGNGPDLFIGAHDRVGDWAEAELIEPISFWVDQDRYHRYIPSALEAFTYQRQLYGLPISCKALALFYNPKLVEAPDTVEALIDHMRKPKITASQHDSPSSRIWGLAYPEIDSLYFHAPWLHAFGGLALKGGVASLNSDPMKESATLIKGLRDEGLIPPELDGALASTLFRSGRLAYLINGPWFIAELQETPRSNWSVARLPRLAKTSRELQPYLSVEGVMISSRAKDRERAWHLASYLSSKPLAERRLKRGELIARTDVDRASLSTWQAVFQAQVSASVPLSNDPKMKALWTPAKRALGQTIVYHASINTALIEAQSAVEKAISEANDHGR